MTEVDRMIQQTRIELMLQWYSEADRGNIIRDIEEFKNINSFNEDISTETITLLIFLYNKYAK